MTTVSELRTWLNSLPDDDMVGVDDGGLCLVVHGREDEEWFEIGGMPEENENADRDT